jgi:undecaprenyl diphosphate synthase
MNSESAVRRQIESLPDVPRDKMPRHIAIIMDGNGRWARQRGLPRIEGHRRGVASVRRTTEECARLGIEQLTLYCLSSENWKRPASELDFLMHLLEQYLVEERTVLLEENIRLRVIGRREGIPAEVQTQLDKTMEMTRSNTGMGLCLAINYGDGRRLWTPRGRLPPGSRPAS